MAIDDFTITLNGAYATICARGAVVTSWVVPTPETFNVIDGYASQEEVDEADGCRSAVLAPWSNRISDARFTYRGVEYDFGVGDNGEREALHGLVLDHDFTVTARSEHAITLETTIEDENYPQPVRVSVTYELSTRSGSWALRTRISGHNLGAGPTPIGLGWHPYIRYDGPRENAYVTVPARTVIRTDERLIPLDGAEAFERLESFDPVSGLATIQPLEQLDTAHSDLTASQGEEAVITATLHHGSGATTDLIATAPATVNKASGIIHLFTGEPLAHRAGESLAFEYCQFMTNAFNRVECARHIDVGAGDTRTMTVTLVHTPRGR
ncbi:MAG: hypothetical protein Q4P71_00455 [Actinomycetaceae bacterium]|nr:hypothetical protein [Actinomycetaceae bacterium]